MAFDPDYNSVSLLLHCDGTNGSTTFTDHSLSPKTVTANGNAQISTTQSKFGGAAGAFDGTGDYLSADHADFAFGAGNFTIEAWIYLNANTDGGFGTLAHATDAAGLRGVNFWIVGGSGAFRVRLGRSEVGLFVDIHGSGSLSTGQWYHIAVTRESTGSNGVKLWVDGTLNAQGTCDYDLTHTKFVAGRSHATVDAEYLNGYLDDIRVTKNVARYTSNFTPPTETFPNSAPPNLTGQSVALSYGAFVPSSTITATGINANATIGTPTPQTEYPIAGVQSTLSAGTTAQDRDCLLSGGESSVIAGAFQDVLSGIWFDIVGHGFSAAEGALSCETSRALSGTPSGLQYGIFGVFSESTASLTGESLALSNSQFGVTTSVSATGISAASVIGLPAFVKFAQLSGRLIQSYKGQAVGTLRAPIAGFSAALAKDTVWPALGLKSSATISASAGSIFKSGTIILEGNAVIADVGDAFPRIVQSVIGSQVAASKGGLQYSASAALTGKSTSPSINPLRFSSSDKQSTISGKSITFSAGSLYIGADPWYNFIRVLAVDGAMDSGGSQVVIVLEDIHPDITVIQLA